MNGLEPGDEVTIRFPVQQRTERYTLRGTAYTYTFRGNTVVDVSPREQVPDDSVATYQREHLKAETTPMVTKKQYVAPKLVEW